MNDVDAEGVVDEFLGHAANIGRGIGETRALLSPLSRLEKSRVERAVERLREAVAPLHGEYPDDPSGQRRWYAMAVSDALAILTTPTDSSAGSPASVPHTVFPDGSAGCCKCRALMGTPAWDASCPGYQNETPKPSESRPRALAEAWAKCGEVLEEEELDHSSMRLACAIRLVVSYLSEQHARGSK
jgi:hypothetical protein